MSSSKLLFLSSISPSLTCQLGHTMDWNNRILASESEVSCSGSSKSSARQLRYFLKIHTPGPHPVVLDGSWHLYFFQVVDAQLQLGASDLVQLLTQNRSPTYVAFSGISQGRGRLLHFEVPCLLLDSCSDS